MVLRRGWGKAVWDKKMPGERERGEKVYDRHIVLGEEGCCGLKVCLA